MAKSGPEVCASKALTSKEEKSGVDGSRSS